MRGEHRNYIGGIIHGDGSSPHAWGAFVNDARGRVAGRFIPTCVGSIDLQYPALVRRTVHPHMRGEHPSESTVVVMRAGSSPHAWGASRSSSFICTAPRFIPTCVGSMATDSSAVLRVTVHPHMRGEHATEMRWLIRSSGSSPHAWGAYKVKMLVSELSRFIPTCVGSMGAESRGNSPTPVHPHMRGEHSPSGQSHRPPAGSSPHAWGA